MLGEIFYWIFNMSIAASICAIPIIFIRRIRKIPRRFFLWLWLIPFTRMSIPIGISSDFGIMALLSKITTKTVTIYEFGDNKALTMMNHIMGATEYFPITYKYNILENLFEVASIIWLSVALTAIIFLFTIYAVTLKEMKNTCHFKDNIYFSDKINSPAVYGIFKPKIILPSEYEDRELKYVLLHENAHIKRRDNLIRLVAFIIACIHWFNPLLWLVLKMLYSDIELACDEKALTGCSENERKEYARSLLYAVEKASIFAAAFGGAKVKTRIENILSYKKISLFSIISFSILVITIAYVLLTNA